MLSNNKKDPQHLNTDGLYIRQGEIRNTNELYNIFKENKDYIIPSNTSPHVITSALKLYLHSIDPLIPSSCLENLQSTGTRSSQEQFLTLTAILQTLPPYNIRILSFLCNHWSRIIENNKNKAVI